MDLSGLNSKQREAVEQINGALLILAGAGSGKTSTMTHRMAYMIEQGISPRSILAVTFTNKAAAEMRSRVESLVPDTTGMWVMTFHAMCLRMLRYQSEILGYKNGFTVYDTTDQKALIKRVYKDLGINEKEFPVQSMIGFISSCKEKELTPEAYIEVASADHNMRINHNVYQKYQHELMANNAMDFDDLLLNGVRLLQEDKRVLEHYRHRFQYIMVDEYQDTNYLQYKMIKMLASGHGNICVVGDDDQCIYQWRGADIRNILGFEEDFPRTKVIKLEQNYRSDANILNLANSVIKNNHDRKSKKLWTDRHDGELITYRRCGDDKIEARYVSLEIERLVEEGYKYSDFAILYRRNAQSRNFEENFSFRRIPFRTLSGVGFYERKEIKDVTSYLRLLENPDDDVAMARVINEPKRGVGTKSLASIIDYAKSNDVSIFGALCKAEVRDTLSSKSRVEVEKFISMIIDLIKEKDNMTLSDMYDNVLNRSGYLKALEIANTVEADGRIENIMEFKSAAIEFEESLQKGELDRYIEELNEDRAELEGEGFVADIPTPLGTFLERISLMADIDKRSDDEDAVVLMTLHSAKGLEFPVVFMPGMETGIFPGPTAYDSVAKMEEERRLCYVGITRAKKKLYLTSAEQRMLYGRTDYTTESQFLNEMDKSLVEGDKTVKDREATGGGFAGDGSMTGDYFFGGRTMGTWDGYKGTPKDKPFDSLAASKRATKAKRVSAEDFNIGDRLKHPKFGEGMLIEQDAKTMSIMFDSVGLKKLGKGFVKMEKI